MTTKIKTLGFDDELGTTKARCNHPKGVPTEMAAELGLIRVRSEMTTKIKTLGFDDELGTTKARCNHPKGVPTEVSHEGKAMGYLEKLATSILWFNILFNDLAPHRRIL
ncbi:hypothetical protein PIB30_101590 [Stylosanthes scabra]|uniref:Uncharacterized protein n=1 Tax=Stylosanthes scabra TaxID=79078 RepID=A0ABU6SXR4_9FABA|nr:hypothetical protein [Stylosanthes scabra]